MSGAPLELRILGPTELVGPASAGYDLVRQPKRLALLSYLALTTADGFRRRDQVTALFWPELDQAQARTYLRKTLHAIRETLEVDVFVTRGEEELRVDGDLLACDAVALPRKVGDGRCDEALRSYRGELLEGLFPEGVAQEFEEWLDSQRKVLRASAAQAAWTCCERATGERDLGAATVYARRALELQPDNEESVRRLMALLDARGDRAGSLRVYGEWKERLQSEFGVEPDPQTRKLARKVQAARRGESHETPPLEPALAVRPGTTPGIGSSRTARSWIQPVAAGALGLVVIAAAWSASRRSTDAEVNPRSVGIGQLRPLSTRSATAAAAITEELTTALATDTSLVTVAATVPSPGDVPFRAAAYIVSGGVQSDAGQLRVTLRLVRSSDGVAVWAYSYDANERDIASASRRLAHHAALAIRARMDRDARLPGRQP